jgi:hypothetical protein
MNDALRRLRPLSFAELQSRVAAVERHAGATIIVSDAERRARASIDARRESPMTADEWREARANLLAFVSILSDWSQTDDRS